MIEVGDLVRFSNEYLRQFRRRRWSPHQQFRGKQEIAKVIKILRPAQEQWLHGKKKVCPALVKLDVPDRDWLGKEIETNMVIVATWLRIVRKAKK
jgi:hypothetical protein